jgi:hypothetical protein
MKAYGPKRIVLEEMNRKGEFVRQEHNVMPLSESSLNQMMDHGKTGMIIISANRSAIDSDNPKQSLRPAFDKYINKMGGYEAIDSDALYNEEQNWLRRRNAAADKQLLQDIKNAGYTYTPVYGGYHGSDDVQDSYEPSYVVYNYKRSNEPADFQELEALALKLCSKYHQDSVYVQRPNQPPVYLDCDGNQVNSSSSDNFKFNRDKEQFYTTNKRDKSNPQRFTSDIVFENLYIPLRPASYNENMRRLKSGEYIL